MRTPGLILAYFFAIGVVFGQPIDISRYEITATPDPIADQYFKNDRVWRGADGAGSIDLGNRRVLWLFGDSFISGDWTGARNGAMVRNSVAIQNGYDLTAPVKYYWRRSGKTHDSFFPAVGKSWFWPGHGTLVAGKLLIFLFEVRGIKTGLGFEPFHWYAAIVANPEDEPSGWKIEYVRGIETQGVMAGSAAVLTDDKYLYAFSAKSPLNDVFLLRWELEKIRQRDFEGPQWWTSKGWRERGADDPEPRSFFRAGTEFSIHHDSTIRRYVMVYSIGFGEASIGVRLASRPEGPWSDPAIVYKPSYEGIPNAMMYSAKAHPELHNPNGVYVTYNVNAESFHLLKNQNIYFPKFITLQVREKRDEGK